jgi:hypothetical protein
MDTFLKIDSTKSSSKCNCLDPFFLNNIDSVSEEYGRIFNKKDVKNIKSTLYRVSNNNGCTLGVCCDPNSSYDTVDQQYLNNFKKVYPSIKVIKEGGEIESIILSKDKVQEEGWIEPTPYYICKISKSKISETNKPNLKIATQLVKNCYTDSCDNTETLTFNNIVGKSLTEEKGYTAYDDSKVAHAVINGDINYVKEYIRKYKQVDNNLTHDNNGNRLLHKAAESKHNNIMDLLLALKPDINVKNTKGHTPLHIAVINDNYDHVETLIKLGAEIKVVDIDGNIPIFYTLKNGNISMARLLYSSGSGVLSKNKNNDNTLHHCIKHGHKNEDFVKIINFLLERGVSTNDINNDGKTPLELIKERIDKHENKENFVKLRDNNIDKYHQHLLEVQTAIFNSTIINNPDKYKNYINVSEVPKGAPIEILDTLCVGKNVTGNESSHDCVAKGGKIIKIKEPSTKIKLSLIPDEKSYMDNTHKDGLYLQKNPKKINNGKHTPNLKKYHSKVNPSLIPKDVNEPQPIYNEELDKLNALKESSIPEHPVILEEDSEENVTERRKAIKNSQLVTEKVIMEEELVKSDSSTATYLSLFHQYKLPIIIGSTIVMIAVIYILVKYLIPKLRKNKPDINTI